MGNTDKIKVKDVSWIQRLEIELNVGDDKMIESIKNIIDNDIHDGVFSFHFVATKGGSYECFGFKKYTGWVSCIILSYFFNNYIYYLSKTRTSATYDTHWIVNRISASTIDNI